jgi:hypothetical protein
MIVNAHYINPYCLSDEWMEFDLLLTAEDGREWRGYKLEPRPLSTAALSQYAASLIAQRSTEEDPLELGSVEIDLPFGVEE